MTYNINIKNNNTSNKPLIFSVLLHAVLLAFLIINLSSTTHNPVLENTENNTVIQAVMVSSSKMPMTSKAPLLRPFRPPPPARGGGIIGDSHLSPTRGEVKSVANSPSLKGEVEVKSTALQHRIPSPLAGEGGPKGRKGGALSTPSQLKKTIEQDLQKQLAQEVMESEISKEIANSTPSPNKPSSEPAVQASASAQGEIDKYKALIVQAIGQHWLIPEDIQSGFSCELLIRVGDKGEVLSVEISRSSGDNALDRSARAAVFKATPLPLPKEAEVFDKFRELRLTVRPENIF